MEVTEDNARYTTACARKSALRDPARDLFHTLGHANGENVIVTDLQREWFPEAAARTDGEVEFLNRLRYLASSWNALGLSPDMSEGVPELAGVFAGIELPHLTAQLRWLWIHALDSPGGILLSCAWGDRGRLDDWGPIDGNVYPSNCAEGTPRNEAGDAAASWVTSQALRPVRRETWVGKRPLTSWTFADTGAHLDQAPRGRWRRPGEQPASTELEQLAR